MQLLSTAFNGNQPIPARYTCDGENEHPPLTIKDPPKGARCFALVVHDPDAVSGDFVHWILWNIPPDTRDIPAGILPDGAVQGQNSWGKSSYGGPCPPDGTGIHHYQFDLLALDTPLDLDASALLDEFLKTAEEHEIARATLVGLYTRDADREAEGIRVPVSGNR